MTRRQGLYILVLSVLTFSLGCARLPENSVSPGSSPDLSFCCAIFPAEPWESVHKIEATIRGGGFSTLLGVTRGDPSERRLHSLLLTPEGFILFEAELRDGKIRTLKALTPFDSPAFTRGLMEDVTLIFLCPQGKPASWRMKGDVTRTCLWEGPDGSRTEVKGSMELGWRILRQDNQGGVTREVSLNGPFVQGLASHLELRAFQPAAYDLRMTLLQTGP
ncbi:MAG: hypothetical protein NTV04_09785 [Deltaproteobacteria bacterium]|nr:hypothetical protein [Deltaproteobacteria bacterium]